MEMSNKVLLVTAVQEKLDNHILTVRHNGTVIGRVYQDAPGKWRVLPPEQPKPPAVTYVSLIAAVEAMLAGNA